MEWIYWIIAGSVVTAVFIARFGDKSAEPIIGVAIMVIVWPALIIAWPFMEKAKAKETN